MSFYDLASVLRPLGSLHLRHSLGVRLVQPRLLAHTLQLDERLKLAPADDARYDDTIRYDSVYLTCSKKLTGSQLSLPHGINKK